MYKSPIDLIITDIQHQIAKEQDEQIYQAVVNFIPNIDKDELLRALQYDRGQYGKGYADGKADATPRWIPVTERLPDTAERVLICKTWHGVVYKPEYGYYQDYPNQKGCWYVLTEFGYYPQTEITHWMPLPEPPKGE